MAHKNTLQNHLGAKNCAHQEHYCEHPKLPKKSFNKYALFVGKNFRCSK